jgi:hypothetical protein
MSRMKMNAKATAVQVKPLANNTKAAAGRGLRKARAWTAPQVERAGQAIQDSVTPAAKRGVRKARTWAAPQVERAGQAIESTVAPKVAAALTSTARRLEPDKTASRGRWRVLAGVSALLAGAAAALAAAMRKRTADSAAEGGAGLAPAEQMQANADGAEPRPAHTS